MMFWTEIAKILQYFRNLSNCFINIFAILQDFNEIFSKYSFNIKVLCGSVVRSPFVKTYPNFETFDRFFKIEKKCRRLEKIWKDLYVFWQIDKSILTKKKLAYRICVEQFFFTNLLIIFWNY